MDSMVIKSSLVGTQSIDIRIGGLANADNGGTRLSARGITCITRLSSDEGLIRCSRSCRRSTWWDHCGAHPHRGFRWCCHHVSSSQSGVASCRSARSRR